jgi:hypothetical protein
VVAVQRSVCAGNAANLNVEEQNEKISIQQA